MIKNPKLIDMSGKQFGDWLVVSKSGNAKGGGALWQCRCSCGTEKIVTGGDLRAGKSLSCGCKGSRTTIGQRSSTHRMKGTKIHTCWSNMHQRCKDPERKHYGAKGISVCAEWRTFASFYEWAMKSGYSEELTIERLDNSKGYSPENCEWATRKEQARNRTIVHMAGPDKSFAEIAEENGISVAVMNNRVAAGKWSHEKAATTKVGIERKLLPHDAKGRFLPSTDPWRR